MRNVGGTRSAGRAVPPAWLVAVLLALPALSRAAPAADRDVRLLAHGSREQYWIARVHDGAERGGTFITDVYSRPAGDAGWRQVARVEGRSVDLADRDGQLALLLDGGGWLLVSEETVATGRPAPPGARILGLASRGGRLLAVARLSGTPPSTAPVSSQPATRSAQDEERLVLLSLGPQGWAEIGEFEIAGPMPGTAEDVSLAVVEGLPLVAVREGPGAVTVYRHGPRAGEPTPIETRAAVAHFKLLGGGPVPVLWTVESGGAARLNWLAQGVVTMVDVDVKQSAAASDPATTTYAIERVRVLSGAGLNLLERAFDALTGTPAGEPARISLPRTPVVPRMFRWVEPLLTILLLFTIVSSLRRRREMQETMQSAHRLPLAPYGRRLLAGAIDAAPLFASVALLYYWEKQAEAAGAEFLSVRSQVAALSGVVVYLLHTSASEIAFGRTIGKAACGLRVVGLDGERAPPGSLLIRNLLRLIDLSMVLFPLVLVLYSPLRQRAGDVAAGTLVVLDKVGPEDATEAEGAAETPAKEKVPETADT